MKTTNWIPITFYSILLILLIMISSGETRPWEQTGAIFDTPDIAKQKCPKGDKWDGVQCLPFIH